MDCDVQGAMIGVTLSSDSMPSQAQPPSSLPSALYSAAATTDHTSDQAQFEADKRAVYKHPLFPLLALLFERCELATQSSDPQSSDAFNMDIQTFVQLQERDRKPILCNEPEIDGLMIKAIQVLRIHLLELEKVQELCKDFCNRYITCLKGKMQSENLLRTDYPQGACLLGNAHLNSNNSESGSASNSPVQYLHSPPQQPTSLPSTTTAAMLLNGTTGPTVSNSPLLIDQKMPLDLGPVCNNLGQAGLGVGEGLPMQQQVYDTERLCASGTVGLAHSNLGTPITNSDVAAVGGTGSVGAGSLIIQGSTPIGQIGASLCASLANEASLTPLSPAPTTPSGSADDCDSDFTSMSRGSRKQKRGVLPKQATSVMRSWLFQHLVHPYPTEDEKRHIAAQTNLTLLQVNNWFINARRRILQPMLDATQSPHHIATAAAAIGDASGAISPHTNGLLTVDHQNNNANVGGTNHNDVSDHKTDITRRHLDDNQRRLWPQDFIESMQQHLNNSGMLSSSEDDGEEGEEEGDDGDEEDSEEEQKYTTTDPLVLTNGQQQQQQQPQQPTTSINNCVKRDDSFSSDGDDDDDDDDDDDVDGDKKSSLKLIIDLNSENCDATVSTHSTSQQAQMQNNSSFFNTAANSDTN